MNASIDHFRQLLFVTGLSGAGRSSVAKTLSDRGYFTIENLPVPLINDFFEYSKTLPERFARTAIMLDIATRDRVGEVLTLLDAIPGGQARLLFIDCETSVIVKRYSETRRPHPAFEAERDRTIEDSIERERTRLLPLRERAQVTINTSAFSVHQLRREVEAFIASFESTQGKNMQVSLLSFGFRYGIPAACDLVLDVRFLPNPYFVPELRERTGLDADVAGHVLGNSDAQEFVRRSSELLQFLIPKYLHEGKSYLTIGIGCTGGRHRSVAITQQLEALIPTLKGMAIGVKHRDVEK